MRTTRTAGRRWPRWPRIIIQAGWITANFQETWTMIQTGNQEPASGLVKQGSVRCSRRHPSELNQRIRTGLSRRPKSRKCGWGEYPMALDQFLRITEAMRESRFPRYPGTTGGHLPPRNPHPTGIQIHWIERAAVSVPIQYCHAGWASQTCHLQWNRDGGMSPNFCRALEAEAQKLFVWKPGRRTA